MTVYAHVTEDGKINGVYDLLPSSWKNISNFYVFANDLDCLKTLGWHLITRQECDPSFNWGNPTYEFLNGAVIEQRKKHNVI